MTDMSTPICIYCGKDTKPAHNYCDWKCHVEHVKASGGRTHLPNGLPVGCVMHDGTMLEIEHGDHPDYRHPVEIKWTGEPDPVYQHFSCDHTLTDDEIRNAMGEYHALIYTDGTIAVTMYECGYHTWYVKSGKPMAKRDEGFLLVSLEIPEYYKRTK